MNAPTILMLVIACLSILIAITKPISDRVKFNARLESIVDKLVALGFCRDCSWNFVSYIMTQGKKVERKHYDEPISLPASITICALANRQSFEERGVAE